MSRSFKGTGVALVTPFDNNNKVDFESLKKLVNYVTENGADYLVVNGTTGESPTTSASEKNEILKFVINVNAGKLPVIFGIGGNNTAEVVEKVSGSDLRGVDAILSVCPYYNKPSQEGIFQHYREIAKASSLPIILYNVPGRTGVNMSSETTIRLSQIDNIIGIKEANPDLVQAEKIIKGSRKGFLLISGDDLATPDFIRLGGIGIISVLANAFPEKFSQMVNQALIGRVEESKAIASQFDTINPMMYEEANPVGIKAALEILKITKANVRLPLVKASDGLYSRIRKEVEAIIKKETV